MPAIDPCAPAVRVPVRTNGQLLAAVAAALTLPSSRGGAAPPPTRAPQLLFQPTPVDALVSVDAFPLDFPRPRVDTTRRAYALLGGNYLAVRIVLALEAAIASKLLICNLLTLRAQWPNELLRAIVGDGEVLRLLGVAMGGASPPHEVYELAWIVGAWYVQVAWVKFDTAGIAEFLEAAKKRDATRASSLRVAVTAMASARGGGGAAAAAAGDDDEVALLLDEVEGGGVAEGGEA